MSVTLPKHLLPLKVYRNLEYQFYRGMEKSKKQFNKEKEKPREEDIKIIKNLIESLAEIEYLFISNKGGKQ